MTVPSSLVVIWPVGHQVSHAICLGSDGARQSDSAAAATVGIVHVELMRQAEGETAMKSRKRVY
jgi:hypothetical protein